jgi:hypothetical protein
MRLMRLRRRTLSRLRRGIEVDDPIVTEGVRSCDVVPNAVMAIHDQRNFQFCDVVPNAVTQVVAGNLMIRKVTCAN